MAGRLWIGAVAAAVAGLTAPAFADVRSTFDTDDEGWRGETRNSTYSQVFTTFTPVYSPAGFIRITDPTGQYTVFRAPPAYEGDQSRSIGGGLAFDHRTDSVTFPAGFLCVIVGRNGQAISAPMPIPPLNTFKRVCLPFTKPGLWRTGRLAGSTVASPAEIAGVLADVEAVLIGAEFGADQAEETVDLDNVILGPILCSSADVNCDGIVNFADVQAFVQLFQSLDPAADVNGDGAVNFADVQLFIALFNNGC